MNWKQALAESFKANPYKAPEEETNLNQFTMADSGSLVDNIISVGDDPEFPNEPEDKYGNPKQLNTITKLRKDGWDNSRIFKALELEGAEEASTKTSKPDIDGEGKNFIGPMAKRRTSKQKFAESFKRAATNSRLDAMYYKSYHGMPGSIPFDEMNEIIEEYEEKRARDPIEAENFIEYVIMMSSGLGGTMTEGLKAGLPYATAGMTGAAAVGAVTPMIPDELFTVPLSGGSGMAVGSTIFWTQQGSGMMIRNMINRGVDPKTAGILGNIGGLFYGAIERLQVSKFIPKSIQNKANDLIAKSVTGTIGKWTKAYGKDWVTQIAEEEVQLVIENIATELGATIEGVPRKKWEVFIREFIETAKQTGAGLIPGQVGRVGYDVVAPNIPKIKDIASGLQDTNKELASVDMAVEEDKITIETQSKQITEDKTNDFNIVYDKENTGDMELSEDEIIASGYEIDLNKITPSREDEYGNKFYAVKIKGETDSQGNIKLTNSADRSTLLEETVEARLKGLQKSKKPEDQALVAKIEIWMESVRKKASEMGFSIRFSDTAEGNIELFSDAIVYGLGGFKGLSKEFEDAIYIPSDISSEFVEKFGKLADGTNIFEMLKGSEKGITTNQEFQSAVDEDILSQVEKDQEKTRPPPAKPPIKSVLQKKLKRNDIDQWFHLQERVVGLTDNTLVSDDGSNVKVVKETAKSISIEFLDGHNKGLKKLIQKRNINMKGLDPYVSILAPGGRIIDGIKIKMEDSSTKQMVPISEDEVRILKQLTLPDPLSVDEEMITGKDIYKYDWIGKAQDAGEFFKLEGLIKQSRVENLQDKQTKFLLDAYMAQQSTGNEQGEVGILFDEAESEGIITESQRNLVSNLIMKGEKPPMSLLGDSDGPLNLDEELEKLKNKYSSEEEVSSSSYQLEPAFKKWFKGSKVKDKQGNPLVLYHGTVGDFDSFNTPSYFSDAKMVSEFIMEEVNTHRQQPIGENIKPVYLSIQNPKIYTTEQEYDDYVMGPSDTFDSNLETLKNQGFDGIIYKPEDTRYSTYYVAFEPTQIKSAFNQGAFDPNDANISYQLEPAVVEKAVSLYPDVMGLNKKGKLTPKAGRLNRFLGRIKTKITKANPIQKDIPIDKMIGKPKNKTAKKIELENGGIVWIGAEKTTDQWLEQVNSVLTEEEQITASKWYEEAYPIFVEKFGQEEAIPNMVGWLMGNVNASPQQALSNLYLGAEQLRSELASVKSAGLPGAAKNVELLLSGQETTEGAGVKLYDFLDSALGKTTRTIMKDDPLAGAPFADDRHSNRDLGFVDSTLKNELLKQAINPQDVWSIKIDQKTSYTDVIDEKTGKPKYKAYYETDAEGNKVKRRKKMKKGSTPGPTETQYEWAVRKFQTISKELNERGYLGGNKNTFNHQAVGWTAMARMLGTSDGMSIPDSFKNQEPTLTFELNFGENTPMATKYGSAYKNLNLDEQVALTKKMVNEVIPEIAKDIGIIVENINTDVVGGWKGDVNANATMSVKGSDQAIKGLADMIGLMFEQDAVGIAKLSDAYTGLGLAFSHNDLIDKNIMEMVYKIIHEESDNDFAPGFFYEELTHPENGLNQTPSIVVGSFIEQEQYSDYEDALQLALERVRNELDIELNYNVFGSKYEQRENNWSKNPKGEIYRNSILESFGKPLLKRLDDYHGKKVERILESEFGRKEDQHRKTRQLVPNPDYAAEIKAAEEVDRKLDLTESDWVDYVKKQIFDKLHPLVSWQKDISEQFLGNANIRDYQNVVLATELYVGRVPELLKDFNNDIIETSNKDSFIMRLVDAGVSTEDFNLYLHALHATERNAKVDMDGGSGMTNQEARTIKTDLNKKYGLKKLKAFTKEFRTKVIDASLDRRLETGLIDQETYDMLKSTYKNYVPLFRVMDDKEALIDNSKMGTSSFDVKGKEFYKARGSKREVQNVLVSSIEQYHSATIRAEKNLVNKRLLSLVESYPSDSYAVRGLKHKPVYDKDGEIDYMMPVEGKKDGEDSIHVKIDGKVKQIVFFGDQGVQIAKAMKDLGATKGIKTLHSVNNYLRYVNTIANPEFMVTNFVRDIQTAGINITAEQGSNITAQALSPFNLRKAWKGVYNIVQKGETDSEWGKLYETMRRAGGKTGFFDYQTIEEKLGKLEKDLKRVESTGRGVKVAGRSIFNFIENLNEATESAVRLTLFKAMLDNGYSEEQAASGAKNVTINFNRKGEVGQYLNSLYLFANAGWQGTGRIYGVVKNSKKAQAAVSGLAAMGFMESILNNMASEEDDEYDKLPNWEKDNNFIMRYGAGDKFFKLRLPYGYNVFKVAGNIAGDVAWRKMNNEPIELDKQFLRFLSAANSAFNPIGGGDLVQTLAPTILDPFIQLSTNKAFHGGPLKPTSVYGPIKAEVEQSWSRTPGVYKDLSQWYFAKMGGHIRYNEDGSIHSAVRGPMGSMGDVSPEVLEFFVDYLGGGLGKTMFRTVNTVKGAVNYDADYTKAPFVRQFYGKFDNKSESRILYDYEKSMKIQVYDDKTRLKYVNYLQSYYEKGNMSRKDFEQRYARFVKAQRGAMRTKAVAKIQ